MIENERKYVLTTNAITDFPPEAGKFIQQLYLSQRARIRKTVVGSTTKCEFTYKVSIAGVLEEITHPLTDDEYARLQGAVVRGLTKIRHTIEDGEYHWDVDFFYFNETELYFALAECEMAPGLIEPTRIPPEISKHIVFTVPVEQTEDFTSHSLSSVDYAIELYREFS